MGSSVLAVVLVTGTILSCGGCTLAYHGASRWEPFQDHRPPIDAMIDVVNELTVDIMQDFAYSRGNFAFSPYGATSVLVALYEGSRGESARQIHRALRLPWIHDVTRIGVRDLHRRLRVHFVNEGFLSGITFNKNTTTFLPEYIRALRFYGYEVETATPTNFPTPATQSPQTTSSIAVPDSSSTESETLNTVSPASSESETTEEQSASTTSAENTTEDKTENVNFETTATSLSSFGTTYESTTKYPETEISELTPESSQTVTAEVTSVPQISVNTETTSVSVMTTDVPVSTRLPSTLTTTDNGGGATDEVGSTHGTETPLDILEVTNATSIMEENNTDIGNFGSTVSEITSEQTTPVSTSASTESYLSTEKGTENTSEQPLESTPSATEITTASQASETETATADKYPSTLGVVTPEEVTYAETNEPDTPTNQVTVGSDTSVLPSTTEVVTSSELPVGNTVIASEGVSTESFPSEPASSEGIESTSTPPHESTSTEEPTTEYLPTTSTANEDTQTFTSTASIGETSTYSEEAMTTSSTNTPDTVERIARSIETVDTNAWPSDAPVENTVRRIVKRSFTDGLGLYDDFSLQLQNDMLKAAGASRGLGRAPSTQRLTFLVDGLLEEKVPVVTYDAVLPFAFVPRLGALALELPLENEWHRLVILLPLERRGLQELLYDLSSYPLRKVLTSLYPRRVTATIPNIVVEGFVVLTPTLQKLGIWDVFDPRRSDLSGMSRDPELYVRDLEQTISVDIRSNSRLPELGTRSKMGRHRIEHFVATHPFLYFVVDRDTKVPLIAGKMVDPLNTRIH